MTATPSATATPEHDWHRLQALRTRHGGRLGALAPPAIVESWSRSLRAGLDCTAPLSAAVVAETELRQRRERLALVRRLAQVELETLAQQIAGSNFLLAFADVDGVLLDLYADNRFEMNGSDAGIVVGSCWSESACGTNGLGTALASGQAVSVSGPEHYLMALERIACVAAPVRDPTGRLIGVIDASSYVASRQHHTHALVQMAATQVENGLLLHQMRPHLVLALHARREFLGTLSAGLVAFDAGGTLQAANARARQMLQGLDVTRGATFEQLFGSGFDGKLERHADGTEFMLRDRLGGALYARCVGRPAGPSFTAAASGPAPARRTRAPACDPAAAAGTDAAVAAAFELARAAVRLRAPILIRGETGTGKEVLARYAHAASERAGPFVAVNCGAIPDDLFEAELFGYAGGAFSGARREGSIGLIASADGGTLLLDEIGELPLHLQAALLRFLDDGLVRPVGATASRRIDVQLLAATHVELEEQVAAQRFRADLFYRLNVVRVELPPLRLRRDFAALVREVLGAVDPAAGIDEPAIARLAAHRWPGNFRELRSLLTRAVLLTPGRRLRAADVDALLPAAAPVPASVLQRTAAETIRQEFERTGRSVSQTSRNLGVSRTTVYRYLGGRPA